MEHLPKLMSMKDVTAALNVSRQRVYEFVRKEKLHPQETAAGKIFLASEVIAFKNDRNKRVRPQSKKTK